MKESSATFVNFFSQRGKKLSEAFFFFPHNSIKFKIEIGPLHMCICLSSRLSPSFALVFLFCAHLSSFTRHYPPQFRNNFYLFPTFVLISHFITFNFYQYFSIRSIMLISSPNVIFNFIQHDLLPQNSENVTHKNSQICPTKQPFSPLFLYSCLTPQSFSSLLCSPLPSHNLP